MNPRLKIRLIVWMLLGAVLASSIIVIGLLIAIIRYLSGAR